MMKKTEKAKWILLKASETAVSDDEHSNDEEPRIKYALGNLSKIVSRKRASVTQHGGFQRYLVLDTSRTVTSKPANNTSDEHLRAGRICVTTPITMR